MMTRYGNLLTSTDSTIRMNHVALTKEEIPTMRGTGLIRRYRG